MIWQGNERSKCGWVSLPAQGPAGSQERLAGAEVPYSRPSRPAAPLAISALQYPLQIILADDDAVPRAKTRDDVVVIVGRFVVPG
jgi:hypothetical protein